MGRYKLTRQRQPFYDLFGNSKCGGIQDNYLQQSDGEHVPTKIPAWSRSTLVCPQPMLRQTSPNFYMGRPWVFPWRLWFIFMPFQHVYQRDDENYPVWQDGYCHQICWGASSSRWKVNTCGWFFPLIRYFPCYMTESTSLETPPLPPPPQKKKEIVFYQRIWASTKNTSPAEMRQVPRDDSTDCETPQVVAMIRQGHAPIFNNQTVSIPWITE